ncbi:MAG: hypothetical protein K9K84_11075 [Methylovulum sp.]|nr:hypothetical protein [Methylovulum sp.]
MFILYTGWGYWSYELDWEQIGLEHPSDGREPDQYIQSRLFELPDFAKKEINLQSYAVTEYLLSTDDSDMDIRFPYINTPRFYVCSDPVDYDNYGQPDCKVRKITITLDKLKDSEASNVFTLIKTLPDNFIDDSQRKKLIPHQRHTCSALALLYDFFKQYDIKYSDECSSAKAWEMIMTDEFSSEYIKEKLTNSLILDDGKKLTRNDFSDRYRKRFK